ncbi:MAG: putative DNA modification/repair radical SAM protein [Gudongella sp.]|nr:putative DNA modification/repair radical SAM protein [Gudongella sp.]
MDAINKLKILADAAKYDVSCSSSNSNRQNTKNGLGNASEAGICHSWSDDGRCISLLKILMSNYCIYDCAYCVNRISNDLPRATFTPEEIIDITISFYKRNYIEGLFLSSAVVKSPNYTMECFLQIVKTLREKENFNGYIHLKAIPGADKKLIDAVGKYVDRLSVNIELPTSEGLKMLAPQKKQEDIFEPMKNIKDEIDIFKEEKRKYKSRDLFVPAGQTTQLIVGATNDSDHRILNLSESLYNTYDLKRVYYSAFIPVSTNPLLPAIIKPPLRRENRLYQADWLLRFYGFEAKELLTEENPYFDLKIDPKAQYALSHIDKYPIEINRAEYKTLLRIPGIGVNSARRIVTSRRFQKLNYDDLKKIGVVLKRAKYFILCDGKHYGFKSMDSEQIKIKLIDDKVNLDQLSLFDTIEEKENEPRNSLSLR